VDVSALAECFSEDSHKDDRLIPVLEETIALQIEQQISPDLPHIKINGFKYFGPATVHGIRKAICHVLDAYSSSICESQDLRTSLIPYMEADRDRRCIHKKISKSLIELLDRFLNGQKGAMTYKIHSIREKDDRQICASRQIGQMLDLRVRSVKDQDKEEDKSVECFAIALVCGWIVITITIVVELNRRKICQGISTSVDALAKIDLSSSQQLTDGSGSTSSISEILSLIVLRNRIVRRRISLK